MTNASVQHISFISLIHHSNNGASQSEAQTGSTALCCIQLLACVLQSSLTSVLLKADSTKSETSSEVIRPVHSKTAGKLMENN